MAVICFCLSADRVPSFFNGGGAHLQREQFEGNQRDEVQQEPSPDVPRHRK